MSLLFRMSKFANLSPLGTSQRTAYGISSGSSRGARSRLAGTAGDRHGRPAVLAALSRAGAITVAAESTCHAVAAGHGAEFAGQKQAFGRVAEPDGTFALDRHPGDPLATSVNAIGAAVIGQHPAAILQPEHRVTPRHPRINDHDVAVRITADQIRRALAAGSGQIPWCVPAAAVRSPPRGTDVHPRANCTSPERSKLPSQTVRIAATWLTRIRSQGTAGPPAPSKQGARKSWRVPCLSPAHSGPS